MRNTLLFLAIFCFANTLPGQTFKKGYLILPQGDTLRGYVRDASFERLSESITFKTDQKSVARTYSPEELQGFGFQSGDRFHSYTVHFSPKKNGEMEVAEQRFLHLLADGPVQLFELSDPLRQPFFIQKNGAKPVLLCLGPNGEPDYLATLRNVLADCPTVAVPDDLHLTAPELIELVENHNRCGNPVERQYPPRLLAWGSATMPSTLYLARRRGVGLGLSLEGRPFDRGFFQRVTFGLDLQQVNTDQTWRNDRTRELTYRHQTSYREAALKMRVFTAPRHGKVQPYTFLAARYFDFSETQTNRRPDGSTYFETEEMTRLRPQLGIGVHGQHGRHLFRFEVPLDTRLHVRLGYGLVLWK